MGRENNAHNFEQLISRMRSEVREYDISLLDDSENNHFSRMDGERREEFIESVRRYGVLTPLIIRPKDGRYEILAGHNRKYAAMAAGLHSVPCIELMLSDVDATVVIGVTNHQREKTTDLEWGWTYRATMEAMLAGRCSEGTEEAGTDSARFPGERTAEAVARKYGTSTRTVQRKIRLTYLVPQLYGLCVQRGYPQSLMILLSYLDRITQVNVTQAAVIEGIELNAEIAEKLREREKEREKETGREDHALDIDEIIGICREAGNRIVKSSRPRRYEVDESLFPEGLNFLQKQEYINRALEYARGKRI